MIEFRGVANPARADAPAPAAERGYLAGPGAGSGPGVLVLHPWWGLNDTIKQMCDGLASEGFVVLAPDLYVGSPPATTIDEAERMSEALDLARAEQVMLGGLDHLAVQADGPLGVVGFSMGAALSHWLVRKRSEHVAAQVIFYGAGEPADGQCPVMGHFAALDPYVPAEEVDALEAQLSAAGRLAGFHRYEGVGHWFAEPDRPEFDPAAAEVAWERTLAFLRERLAE